MNAPQIITILDFRPLAAAIEPHRGPMIDVLAAVVDRRRQGSLMFARALAQRHFRAGVHFGLEIVTVVSTGESLVGART